MAIHAVTHHIGQLIAAFHAKRQCQLRPLAKREPTLPFVFTQGVESIPIRCCESKRSQHGAGMGRDTWIRRRQKSNLKANCMRRGSPAENALPKNGPKSGYGPGMPRL